ncbi:putative tyrosinase copper-binding domain-containing protein [Plasmopara halstedii]
MRLVVTRSTTSIQLCHRLLFRISFEKELGTKMGSPKMNFVIVIAAFLCFASLIVEGQQTDTKCSESRVRRSWDTYNMTEKAQYLEAVSVAMDLGYHQKFVQIHVDFMSEKQAHQNCMFIYWHRMLLLGYENMLRSLDSKYNCLTLPYWDHLSAYARQASGQCNSLLSCTPFLTDSGGAMTGVTTRLIIYNVSIAASSSTCVNQGILSHFCGNNSVCAKCITRGSKTFLNNARYPGEASLGSVVQQVFTYSDSAKFTQAVEGGIHNTLHSALNGVMAFYQSPADPIFYLHHGLIDLLQVIYLKCQVGGSNVVLSSNDKSSDSRWLKACAKRTSGYYTNDENVTMRVNGSDGTTLVNVWQDPNNILYPFFKDLPYKYMMLMPKIWENIAILTQSVGD